MMGGRGAKNAIPSFALSPNSVYLIRAYALFTQIALPLVGQLLESSERYMTPSILLKRGNIYFIMNKNLGGHLL